MQPPAVGVEEGHDLDGHDLHVEHFGILEIIVPDLADDIAKEFGDASFDRLVDGVWSSQRGGIYGLPLYEHGQQLWHRWRWKYCRGGGGRDIRFFADMVGFVLNGLCEDGRERMDSLQLTRRGRREFPGWRAGHCQSGAPRQSLPVGSDSSVA